MNAELMRIPRPGEDIVPTDWWKTQVVPWADEQTDTSVIADAAARLAGLEAAYRVLGADTLELTKGRRYLEIRWGVILGPGKPGQHTPPSLASEGFKKDSRSRFRGMAWHNDQPVDRVAFKVLDERSEPDQLSRAKVLRGIREAIAEDRRSEPVEDLVTPEVVIRHGSFTHSDDPTVPGYVLRDLCGTVDAIITDPPYERAWVSKFDDLGELAATLLTANGVLVVMTGQTYMPEYLKHLSDWLEYRWVGAYLTPGPRTRIHHARVASGWKPIMIFQRPGAERTFLLDDVFRSVGDDKEHHHWGQSESGMAALVQQFTTPGQLVVDPCAGGCTTAVVCRDLGRPFVGCDIDAAAVHTARERLDG